MTTSEAEPRDPEEVEAEAFFAEFRQECMVAAAEKHGTTMARMATRAVRLELEARGFTEEFIADLLEGIANRADSLVKDPAERLNFERATEARP